MSQVRLRMPESMVDDIDELVEDNLYMNRSAAVRAAVRQLTEENGGESDDAPLRDRPNGEKL